VHQASRSSPWFTKLREKEMKQMIANRKAENWEGDLREARVAGKVWSTR